MSCPLPDAEEREVVLAEVMQHASGVEIAFLAVGIGLQIASQLLAKKKKDTPFVDEAPPNFSTRGTFLPRILGRQKVGPVICWIGKRRYFTDLGWFESGMHAVCIGPVRKMWAIRKSGKRIFLGPLDNRSHPSGSFFTCSDGSQFRIYWGFSDQLPEFDLENELDFLSKWPYCCYIYWVQVPLGTSSPVWSQYEYEVECRVIENYTSAPGWIKQLKTELGTEEFHIAFDLGFPNTQGPSGVGHLYFERFGTEGLDSAQALITGNQVRLDGPNEFLRGEYTVLYSEPASGGVYTRVFFEETLSWFGDPTLNWAQLYSTEGPEGVNKAAAVSEILFAKHPHGIGESQFWWDMDSLNQWAALAKSERLAGHFKIIDGEEIISIIAQVLQDDGVALVQSTLNGKLAFVPVRNASTDDIPVIPLEAVSGRVPSNRIDRSRFLKYNQIVFVYDDKNNNFRKGTFTVNNDGVAIAEERASVDRIDIPTANDYDTAVVIGERRFQETVSDRTQHKVELGFAARKMTPATPLILEGINTLFRIWDITHDVDSGKTALSLIKDYYGAPQSAFDGDDPPGDGGGNDVLLSDLAMTWMELPEALAGYQNTQLFVARIRANEVTTSAEIWASLDDDTYVRLGTEFLNAAGGDSLSPALTPTGAMILEDGGTFTVRGPDIGSVLDLSGDEAGWRGGAQLLILARATAPSEPGEICFVQGVEPVDATTYRLVGVIRARYGTKRLTMGGLNAIFILPLPSPTSFSTAFQDIANSRIYIKSQANGLTQLSLEQEVDRELVLPGTRPPACSNLFANGGEFNQIGLDWTDYSIATNAFQTGDTIALRWTYRSFKNGLTGAGALNAGDPVGEAPPDASFLLRMYDSSDVLRYQANIGTALDPTRSYGRVHYWIPSDWNTKGTWSGEPSSFKFEILQNATNGNLSVASERVTVVRV